MKLNPAEFLSSKVPTIKVVEVQEPTHKLSPEEFRELTTLVTELKKRIEGGEQVSVEEARLITVWFRARRAENFSVAVAKAKPKKKPAAAPRKRVLKSVEKQALGDALINSL